MSYTLNQLEKFAVSESRRWSITFNVRAAAEIPVGVCFDSRDALQHLRNWLEFGVTEGCSWPEMVKEECLEGATLDELELYCQVEEARVRIRVLEASHVRGETPYSEVQQARRDFKTLLLKVEF